MPPSFEGLDWQSQSPAQSDGNQRSSDRNSSSPAPPPPPPSQLPRSTDTAPPSGAPLPNHVTDRAELIERIKAGETPTWSPARKVQAQRPPQSSAEDSPWQSDRYNPNHRPSSPPPLDGASPSHPYSALHQGIFTCTQPSGSPPSPQPPLRFRSGFTFPAATSPPRPPPLRTSVSSPQPPNTASPFAVSPIKSAHTRNPSLSSSYVLKTPTSPLVHSSKLDSSEPGSSSNSEGSSSPPHNGAIDISIATLRRKSLPPTAPSTLQLSPTATRCIPPSSFRRSLAESWGQNGSPPSPSARLRRQSTHNLSELPPASFVGSYEESILNGRMSTTPSKPLNFLAQIGVLGLGKCKPSLRCPTHVTLPFPAYFYSVGDYDSPSPYVGQIDLDAALGSGSSNNHHITHGHPHTMASKKFPPGVGGCYRIPQRGQLQIVIKNPNKTAVKLFLVQYDLKDMEPGTKTFIRQKSYSAGSLLTADDDISSSPTAISRGVTNGKDAQTLRYMIHLHVVCPSRGRYYLFKNIRVVFANRVPDGKERLRNETLWPDPKYSPWKSENAGDSGSGMGNTLGQGAQQRRRAATLHTNAHNGIPGRNGNQQSHGSPPPPVPALPDCVNFKSDECRDGGACGNSGDCSETGIYGERRMGGCGEWAKREIDLGRMKDAQHHGLLARRLRKLDVEGEEIGTNSSLADMDVDISPKSSTKFSAPSVEMR